MTKKTVKNEEISLPIKQLGNDNDSYCFLHRRTQKPQIPLYQLCTKALLPMIAFLKMIRLGRNTNIAFVDSTPIRVCKNKRICNHKVFRGLAERGISTVGYFYRFKLYIIINNMGEIIDFVITPGNVDDREPLKNGNFLKRISGKLFADKGYISQKLFEMLFVDGIQLITGRKRSVIETVNNELKNIC